MLVWKTKVDRSQQLEQNIGDTNSARFYRRLKIQSAQKTSAGEICRLAATTSPFGPSFVSRRQKGQENVIHPTDCDSFSPHRAFAGFHHRNQ
jgi:hypothetical protein